jgi:pimeloyl-ACP methyl ester carboxylesterase
MNRALLLIICLIFSLPFLHAEDFFFDSAGVKIHYTVVGKGEPVLLIPGFGGDIQTELSVINALSNTFQVIALDNRGHGQSDKPHDPISYGMNLVEDSIRLLDHLKIQKAHVEGYSMGGAIVMELLAFHPERLRTAVIGGAGWNPLGQNMRMRIIRQKVADSLADSLEQGKGMTLLLAVAITPVGGTPPDSEEEVKLNKWFLSRNDPLALAAVLRNFVPEPTEAQIRANKIPVLALIGEFDPNKFGVDSLNGLMPNLKIVVIPRANHGTAPGDPEFMKNFKAFLMEHLVAGSVKGSKN